MKTDHFFELLYEHQDKVLSFEYNEGKRIGVDFKVVSIDHVKTTSITARGKLLESQEVIMSISENKANDASFVNMKVERFIDMLNQVDQIKPFSTNVSLKVRYGNDIMPLTVMNIKGYIIKENYLVICLESMNYKEDVTSSSDMYISVDNFSKEEPSIVNFSPGSGL